MNDGLYHEANWLQKALRFFVFNLVRLFYPKIDIRGRENLPAAGPVMFVLNHPNGLMDPLLLMVGLERPVSFLAKSTLFGNPVGKTFSEAFGALPVYRKRDEGLPGGPRGDASERNEATFARCRVLLRRGGAMALFPEGMTHSGSQLLKLRTGAARIALSTEAEAAWQAGVRIVPVGLWYENKTLFRTSVLLVVGEPFDLMAYREPYARDPYQTVKTVTRQIEAGLDAVVLQAENAELLSAIPVLAAWTVPEAEAPTLTQQHEWTASLLSTYRYLHQHEPARLEKIADQAWGYAKTLQTLGISDPWTLERPVVNLRKVIGTIFRLIVTFPLALAGFLLSYGPYRLAGPVAGLVIGKYDTQISTFKLIGGAIFVLVGWILEAIAAGLWLGGGWGLLLFILSPSLSYIALRWGEVQRDVRRSLTGNWFQLREKELARSLLEQRRRLAQQVVDAVQRARGNGLLNRAN